MIGILELVVIITVVVFFILTTIALIYSTRKRSLEILFKKPFYKDKVEDIKNKILKEM